MGATDLVLDRSHVASSAPTASYLEGIVNLLAASPPTSSSSLTASMDFGQLPPAFLHSRLSPLGLRLAPPKTHRRMTAWLPLYVVTQDRIQ